MEPPQEADELRLTSDADIQRIRLDKVTPHNAPIVLADYDPRWPALFDREAVRIRAALADRAVLLEHAGSTSVPGLAAKLIIDIVLAVPHSADEDAYVPALEAVGYWLRAREPGWFEHRMFKGPDTDINLHVFTAGRGGDRADAAVPGPAPRERGGPRRLPAGQARPGRRTWRHVQHYADAKTAIVEQIIACAMAEE